MKELKPGDTVYFWRRTTLNKDTVYRTTKTLAILSNGHRLVNKPNNQGEYPEQGNSFKTYALETEELKQKYETLNARKNTEKLLKVTLDGMNYDRLSETKLIDLINYLESLKMFYDK